MATTTQCAASLRALLAEAIDYAGLFPPASLEMSAAVANYARYLRHPQSWALGRFVLPASRLDEFHRAQEQALGSEAEPAGGPWCLSAILSSNLDAEIAAVQSFHTLCRSAVIDSIEVRVSQPEEMSFIRRHLPPDTKATIEIAPERADELLPFIRDGGFCAKLRTGGVAAEAIPCVETVAGFLARCAEFGVCLKATAGLHHPLRRVAPLTYAPNSAKATMHGFLNFLTAAALAWWDRQCGSSQDSDKAVLLSVISTCLCDTQPAHWQFTDEALTWTGGPVPLQMEREIIMQVRSNFALSFGSCSFEEPIDELRALEFM